MIQSPLNYTGGKYKLLPQILPLFPEHMNGFVDLFCGGCNVGINVSANHYLYNDFCEPLINLYRTMKNTNEDDFIEGVTKIIARYNLSDTKKYGYSYYGCESGKGLAEYNREGYMRLRDDFNESTDRNYEYYLSLYVLIIYAFNNQIRFNKDGKFNLPPGKRDFNQKMYDKVVEFIRTLHNQEAQFTSLDFRALSSDYITSSDFVYADPPYLITCATYNEQGGWTEKDETDLLLLLSDLDNRGVKFALSNVLESKGCKNKILEDWIESNDRYKLIDLNYSYANANYQRKNKERKSKEILVINY